ncbi:MULTISPECIES: hypothetical protein [unclassified Cryobacterium]|uniref:hypothetical protein n=1 Tax=unclassified Cryobacterium TaxID=2649013 RepID=UPI002AB5A78B|nr:MULTISPECIES: hypothetical protein [unclassified Cryobacterium]MDY7541681.1 hypothetical protein [Cryobacterium sp. 5B3]MEA9999062.1 hypothetical protein [Cryobacterium sp. RTS3]MEB0267225.1 hypothetical protein [Cryobacterium sp. 10I5]MEB0275868.1 hypothetical protein [Cryobacterium sp. 5B3]
MKTRSQSHAWAARTASRCISRLRKAVSVRSMALAIVTLVSASCLAVLGTGGSYAFLNSKAPIAAGTLQSGTATLTASPVTLSTAGMSPGLTVYGAATVTNTGNVPLALRIVSLTPPTNAAAITDLTPSLTIGLAVVASAAVCTAGSVPTWSTVLNATPTAASLGTTLPVGGSAVLCLSVALALDAPSKAQGLTATNFGIVIDGIQA